MFLDVFLITDSFRKVPCCSINLYLDATEWTPNVSSRTRFAKQWLSQHGPLHQVSSDVNDLHSLASGELSARVLLPWFIECLLQVRHIQFDAFGAVFLSSSFFL